MIVGRCLLYEDCGGGLWGLEVGRERRGVERKEGVKEALCGKAINLVCLLVTLNLTPHPVRQLSKW